MADSSPFVGTWKLVAWEVMRPDDTIQYPYGKDVIGYLIYSAEGYMSAEIMEPDRKQSDPDFPLEPASRQTHCLIVIGRKATAPICPIAEPTR